MSWLSKGMSNNEEDDELDVDDNDDDVIMLTGSDLNDASCWSECSWWSLLFDEMVLSPKCASLRKSFEGFRPDSFMRGLASGDDDVDNDSNDSLSRLVAFSLLLRLFEQASKRDEDDEDEEEDDDVIGGVIIWFKSLTKQFNDVAWFEECSSLSDDVAFKAIRLFKLTMSWLKRLNRLSRSSLDLIKLDSKCLIFSCCFWMIWSFSFSWTRNSGGGQSSLDLIYSLSMWASKSFSLKKTSNYQNILYNNLYYYIIIWIWQRSHFYGVLFSTNSVKTFLKLNFFKVFLVVENLTFFLIKKHD